MGVGAAVALALSALQQKHQPVLHPDPDRQRRSAQGHPHPRWRHGGKKGSLERSGDSLDVKFNVTDFNKTVTITYRGILPDLFREGQGIVALGKLNADGVVVADEVLAKHDEKNTCRRK
nr:hypothetical protein GCM10020185_09510 [Pseudomonas brassicacearum subsp. brassicacearum]